MCAALWTRNLERGLPGTTPPRPAERTDAATPAPLPWAEAPPGRPVWWLTRDTRFGPMHLAASPTGVRSPPARAAPGGRAVIADLATVA